MLIDLHTHTRRYSACSSIEPHALLERAKQAGLDGIALTEHGILWPKDALDDLRESARRVDLALFAGQEVSCLTGGVRLDFLVFGVDQSIGSANSPPHLADFVHQRRGVLIAAHPFKPSRLGVGFQGVGEDIRRLSIDAVEYYHPSHDESARERVMSAAHARGLPLTGGGDAHELDQVGRYATRFLKPISAVADMVVEIRAGRIAAVDMRTMEER